jgi:hypothetical protein
MTRHFVTGLGRNLLLDVKEPRLLAVQVLVPGPSRSSEVVTLPEPVIYMEEIETDSSGGPGGTDVRKLRRGGPRRFSS